MCIVFMLQIPGFKKSDSGFYYKFYVQNKDSIKADTSFILTMNIKYRVNIKGKDSVLFNSKDMAKPFQIGLQKPQFKGDVYEAFAMLHKGTVPLLFWEPRISLPRQHSILPFLLELIAPVRYTLT